MYSNFLLDIVVFEFLKVIYFDFVYTGLIGFIIIFIMVYVFVGYNNYGFFYMIIFKYN